MAKQRKPVKQLTKQQISDEYEHLVAENLIEWIDLTPERLEKLPHWTKVYVEWFQSCGISCQIARQVIQNVLVIKTDDPVICYFEHHWQEGVHQWVGPWYREALASNDALAYLASKRGMPEALAKELLKLTDQIVEAGQQPDHENN